jgi:hypothetical protein
MAERGTILVYIAPTRIRSPLCRKHLRQSLSVSVVPRERSGMASGIFNTSKVANEGIALAIVTAALGSMTAAFITGSLVLSADQMTLLPEAAQNIVAGDIKGAMQLLPGLSRATAAQGYFDAFRNLSRCLAALTAFAALIILTFLGKAVRTSVPADRV